MKIKLKTLADKITAVALYLICMTIVISLFLEVSYMADYGFYDKFQLTESTTTRLMKEKVDKEYSNIEEYVLLSFKDQIKKLQSSDSDYELYRSLCEKYNKRDNTNLIIFARTNNDMYKLNNLQKGELNEGELLSNVAMPVISAMNIAMIMKYLRLFAVRIRIDVSLNVSSAERSDLM